MSYPASWWIFQTETSWVNLPTETHRLAILPKSDSLFFLQWLVNGWCMLQIWGTSVTEKVNRQLMFSCFLIMKFNSHKMYLYSAYTTFTHTHTHTDSLKSFRNNSLPIMNADDFVKVEWLGLCYSCPTLISCLSLRKCGRVRHTQSCDRWLHICLWVWLWIEALH